MIGKVCFDGKDTYTEYGLLLASKSISLPEVRTNMIDVPGRDGLLDASEVLTGEVTYKNRTIILNLTGVDTVSGKTWPATISDFCNKVHGKFVKITFPEDTAHFYSGRCSVGQVGLVKMMQTIPVTVDCDPWKYKNAKPRFLALTLAQPTNSYPYPTSAGLSSLLSRWPRTPHCFGAAAQSTSAREIIFCRTSGLRLEAIP